MPPITPVLLCGGSGTRLWPLSRKALPKQFAQLIGDETPYQSSLKRLAGPDWAAPIIVTGEDYLPLVETQAGAIGCDPEWIMVEPSARNTAPAILAAAMRLAVDDPEALMLVAPSDHSIRDGAGFRAAVLAGAEPAAAGRIVTFGVRPTRAETGYGWLEVAPAPSRHASAARELSRFVEKPDARTAATMLASGNCLWNAGIFLASAQTMIDAFVRHAPDLVQPVAEALKEAEMDGAKVRLAREPWSCARDVSIDFAVMENADGLCVVPFAAGWSDLGDWNAIHRETSEKAPDGVATSGSVSTIGCRDSLIRSEVKDVEVVGIGLKDIVVVAMEDTVLVADRAHVQDVKEAVARLRARKAPQADRFVSKGEVVADQQNPTNRRIEIGAFGEKHVDARAPETHWTVLSGKALVQMDKEVRLVPRGTTVCRPAGSWAMISNPDMAPLVLAEVTSPALDAHSEQPAARNLVAAE